MLINIYKNPSNKAFSAFSFTIINIVGFPAESLEALSAFENHNINTCISAIYIQF